MKFNQMTKNKDLQKNVEVIVPISCFDQAKIEEKEGHNLKYESRAIISTPPLETFQTPVTNTVLSLSLFQKARLVVIYQLVVEKRSLTFDKKIFREYLKKFVKSTKDVFSDSFHSDMLTELLQTYVAYAILKIHYVAKNLLSRHSNH